MKTLTTLLTVTELASGCSSIQPVNTFAPTGQDLQARAQYYEDLNRHHHLANIDAVAEINAKFEGDRAEAEMLLEEQGWSMAEYDTVISQIRTDDDLNRAFEAVQVMTVVAQQ